MSNIIFPITLSRGKDADEYVPPAPLGRNIQRKKCPYLGCGSLYLVLYCVRDNRASVT